MIEKELLQDIYEKYSTRIYSQYYLANEYGVSTPTISVLLCRMGFHRTLLIKKRPLDEVLLEKDVRNIVKRILDNMKLVAERKKQILDDEIKDSTFFVNDTINALKVWGWDRISWQEFSKIPLSEYEQYIIIVKLLMPASSESFYLLKSNFDEGLTNAKRGVTYNYLSKLIASIAYVNESGYHGKDY